MLLLEESMKEEKLLLAVVFATYFITLECKLPLASSEKKNQLRRIDDVELMLPKFLSTNEPIWTHTTTASSGELCTVDTLQKLVKNTIYYRHSEYQVVKGHPKKSLTKMEGEFEQTKDMYAHEIVHNQCAGKEMRYLLQTRHSWCSRTCRSDSECPRELPERKTGGSKFKFKHQLEFWDEANGCVVITVLPMSNYVGQKSIDLRVRNSSIHAGPSAKCLKHYHSLASHATVIYKSNCQKLLWDMQSSPQPHHPLEGQMHPNALPKGTKHSG